MSSWGRQVPLMHTLDCAAWQLCGLRQVTRPLQAWVPSSMKWRHHGYLTELNFLNGAQEGRKWQRGGSKWRQGEVSQCLSMRGITGKLEGPSVPFSWLYPSPPRAKSYCVSSGVSWPWEALEPHYPWKERTSIEVEGFLGTGRVGPLSLTLAEFMDKANLSQQPQSHLH